MATTKYIRIEGEAVSAVEEIVYRTIKLPEWLAAMQKLSPHALATPALPAGAALYAQKGDQQLIVINQPASVKKVTWSTSVYRDENQRNKTRWQLAVPPHVFLLVFAREAIHNSHIYYVPKPVTSEKDMLYCTSLANVYFQPQGIPSPICSGQIRLNVKDPFAKRCQDYVDGFWETEFNDDIQPVVNPRNSGNNTSIFADPKTPQPEFLNLHAWEKATTETPDFLTKMTWPFAPLCTLEEILNNRWMAS